MGDDAEMTYRYAINNLTPLASGKPEVYEPYLAMAYSHFACFCDDTAKAEEAEHCFSMAMNIASKYPENDICHSIREFLLLM